MRSCWFVCVIAALALSLSACGGGEKSVHTPDDAELREMVMITSEGLPWSVTLRGDDAKSNEVAANEYPDSEQWLENYDEWARTGGHSANFKPGGEGFFVVETKVEHYSSTGGTKSAWSAVRDFMLSEETLQGLLAVGMSDAQIEEVDGEKVGDESAAFRIAMSAGGETLESFVVLFRRGGVVAMATILGAEGAATMEDTVAVAEQLDAHIQDILKR